MTKRTRTRQRGYMRHSLHITHVFFIAQGMEWMDARYGKLLVFEQEMEEHLLPIVHAVQPFTAPWPPRQTPHGSYPFAAASTLPGLVRPPPTTR